MAKSTTKSEFIIFKDIVFRRYPNSENWADRNYYTPNSKHRRKGVGRLHQELWKDWNGPIPEGCEIHHKDGDPLNNALDNLECLTAEEHAKYHAEHPNEEDTAWRRAHIEAIRPLASAWHKSEAGRAWHSELSHIAWEKAELATKNCENCGREFEYLRMGSQPKYCSNNCKSAARRKSGVDNETRFCEQCEGEFTCNRYSIQKCCSPACARRKRYGK